MAVRLGSDVSAISSARQRCVLAALALRANETISVEALIDAVWGDHPPPTASHAIQVHISSLRTRLRTAGISIQAGSRGYGLIVAHDQLDAAVFERSVADAGAALTAGEATTALNIFDEALAMWRGAALADVPWDRFAAVEVHRLDELRSQAIEDRIEAALALGHNVIADAEAAVSAEPLRERRWHQLMLALYRQGRQIDALRRADELRQLMLDEFGIQASPEVGELERRIRSHDHELMVITARSLLPTSDRPATKFAPADDLYIAYQELGHEQRNLMVVPGAATNLDVRWEQPDLARFYQRLAKTTTLVLADKAGTGMSDRGHGPFNTDQRVNHAIAILDHAEMGTAVLFGIYDGAAIALLAAAMYPSRVDAVITYAASPAPGATGFEGATPPEVLKATRASVGHGAGFTEAANIWAPSRINDETFKRWFTRYAQTAIGIGDGLRFYDEMNHIDIRDTITDLKCPVLVLHRTGDRVIPAVNAKWLESHLPNARTVLLPGADSIIWAGDIDAIADQIETFLHNLDQP